MSPARRPRRWARRAAVTLGLAAFIALLGHSVAEAASDVWGNVGPSNLGSDGFPGRYPLTHYSLDQHFDAVSASLTGGVDVSGVAPMIAYFLASILWLLTSFLAAILISLFSFAFSLDLVNGSEATGGAGALAPVSRAIHSIYSDVFGAPWLTLAVLLAGIWAMWKALAQRRYSETAGAMGLSLLYVVLAFLFVFQPGTTIGTASKWTNKMLEGFLSIAADGGPSGRGRAKDDAANQLFDLLVFKPWVVLNFGGLEHCVRAGSGSEDDDPVSVAVRPLSSDPGRDAALARSLRSGTEIEADGKICVNNANKYAPHFLPFSLAADEHDERGDEYEALNEGDSSLLPEEDPAPAGYRLGVADKPATDAMEEGGQYQRLGLAIVVFVGEFGAFALLGALSVGIILAQVLLLLLVAFAPVALVAAAIPGRGHDFFKGWLQKLAGYLLRKAAYSLILAILLAVNGALAAATAGLGWLMSFGLQALFFWAVFLQRKTLTESLIGIATGPGAPGRDGTSRLLALYYGARVAAGPVRSLRRGAGAAIGAPGRLFGAGREGGGTRPSGRTRAPRFGNSHGGPLGGVDPGLDAQRSGKGQRAKHPSGDSARPGEMPSGDGEQKGGADSASDASGGSRPSGKPSPSGGEAPQGPRPKRTDSIRPHKRDAGSTADETSPEESEDSLSADLRAERGRGRKVPGGPPAEMSQPDPGGDAPRSRRKRRRRKGEER